MARLLRGAAAPPDLSRGGAAVAVRDPPADRSAELDNLVDVPPDVSNPPPRATFFFFFFLRRRRALPLSPSPLRTTVRWRWGWGE